VAVSLFSGWSLPSQANCQQQEAKARRLFRELSTKESLTDAQLDAKANELVRMLGQCPHELQRFQQDMIQIIQHDAQQDARFRLD
jgi:hypothetical protein